MKKENKKGKLNNRNGKMKEQREKKMKWNRQKV